MSTNQAGKGDAPRKVDGAKYRERHDLIDWPSKRGCMSLPRKGQIGKIDIETGLRCIGDGCYERVNTELSNINNIRESDES